MDSLMHPLLQRQLRRLGMGADALPQSLDAFVQLLGHVSRAYRDADKDRYMLERSQAISSREMTELNTALRLSEGRLTSLVTLSSDWIWEQDAELSFKYVSGEPHAESGLEPSLLMGKKIVEDESFEMTHEARVMLSTAVAARKAYRDIVFGVATHDGRKCYVRVSGEPVFEGGQFTGYRGVGSDVTKAALAEQEIQRLARFDSLTGLPNRSMFMYELERTLARSRRDGSTFSVFFLDLDRFKYVNDTLGHAAGDQLLRIISDRLKVVLREADMVARLGGDEFVLLLQGCSDSALLSKVANRTLAAIGEPMFLEGTRVQVSGSVGISVYPADGTDSSALVKNADAAMYQAKAMGKNNFQYYTEALASQASKLFSLEGELRVAVEHDELRLHYQPKFEVSSGKLIGMEALVRWQHPKLGLLSPGEFIEIAEESGLIIAMGRWVINAACQQMKAWRAEGYEVPPCAVNVSVRQFASPTFVDDVRQALESCGLEPQLLEVEVTESLLMSDPAAVAVVLNKIHDMGVAISIDDFGTGYSSLSYLKRFPAHALKIDQSFIRDLPGDGDDAAIVQAVIAMAHGLGLRVVAEGVETASQLEFLKQHGCDEAQGYLLGRPVWADNLACRLSAAEVAPRAKSASELMPLDALATAPDEQQRLPEAAPLAGH